MSPRLPPRGSHNRVLVVGTDALYRTALCSALRYAGYETDEATSVEEACDHLRRHRAYGAIVTELQLPDGDCVDLLTSRRAPGPLGKVVVVTSEPDRSTRRRVLAAGAAELRAKPTTYEGVVALVED